MDEKLEKAIENVLAMIRPNVKPDDALKLSQSYLNLIQGKSIDKKGPTRKAAGA
jgi:hypothetical protein